jgi:hypothetical protein
MKFFLKCLELRSQFSDHLSGNLAFIQDDILIRCESLKEELEILKESCSKDVSRTEKEICR